MTTLRARYDGKVLIPEGSVDLPTGSVLELQVLRTTNTNGTEPNPIERLRRAISSPPQLDEADLEALNEAIERGRLPVDQLGPFHEQ